MTEMYVKCNIFLQYIYLGGYLSSSLAVLSDAAHMLSDFSGILVSLLSLWISRKRATKSMSFGFHRAGELSIF